MFLFFFIGNNLQLCHWICSSSVRGRCSTRLQSCTHPRDETLHRLRSASPFCDYIWSHQTGKHESCVLGGLRHILPPQLYESLLESLTIKRLCPTFVVWMSKTLSLCNLSNDAENLLLWHQTDFILYKHSDAYYSFEQWEHLDWKHIQLTFGRLAKVISFNKWM